MNNIISISITIFCLSLLWLFTLSLQNSYAQNEEIIAAAMKKKFVIYYSDEHSDNEFSGYDVIVFDRENHPYINNLKSKGKIILGYVSGSELDSNRDNFDDLKRRFKPLKENEIWKGSFIVDIRSVEWTAHIIENIIPDMIRKGFSGIFIDTLDSIEELEASDPDKYNGMIYAAVNMIKTIRMHYPNIKIMVNRGYKILPHVANDIDYVLAESTMATHDFETGKSSMVDKEIYQEYVDKAKELRKISPHLQIMTVDYWDMDDIDGVRDIYLKHRENAFIPYVTTVNLEKLHHQPW